MKINPTLVQVGDPVGHIERILHIVRDDNAGHAKPVLQPTNQSIDAVRNDGIESGGRFVVQHAGRPANDRARKTDAFLHSAAQIHRHFFFLPFQFHHFEHFRDFCAQNFRIALASFAQRKGDVFRHRHRIKKRAALKKNADLLADFPELRSLIPIMFWPSIQISPASGLHQTDEMLEQHAFAAAAPSDDREGFAGRDFKIDSTQNFLLSDLFSPMPAPRSLAKICSKPDEA